MAVHGWGRNGQGRSFSLPGEGMSRLTTELKADHQRIIGALGTAKGLGISTPEGHAALMSARDQLLQHLKKEDDQLYPVLRGAAIEDAEMRRMVDYFSRDMEMIAPAVMAFFDKYGQPTASPAFTADFERFFTLLMGRIQKEQTVLFEAFDNL